MTTRVRSTNGVQQTENLYVESKSCSAGGWSDNPDINYSTITYPYFNKSMTDVVTPDFKERISRGEIINNPMTQDIWSFTESTGYVDMVRLKDRYEYNDDGQLEYQYSEGLSLKGPVAASKYLGSVAPSSWPGYYHPYYAFSSTVGSQESEAINRAWANVDLSEAQILETLGESKDTIRFFTSTLRRLIKIYKSIKRLDVKSLKGEISPKELADRYLEARYAIRPLVYDVQDYIKAFDTIQEREVRRTFRGYAEDSVSESIPSRTVYSESDFTVKGSSYSTVTRSSRAGVLTAIELISGAHIWGLNKPVEAMWELVPFSFIIDWFVTVGDTIAAWTPNFGIRALTSWVVNETVYNFSVEVDDVECHSSYYNNDKISITGCYINRIHRHKERKITPNRSLTPSLSVNLDCLKMLDLALILKKMRA